MLNIPGNPYNFDMLVLIDKLSRSGNTVFFGNLQPQAVAAERLVKEQRSGKQLDAIAEEIFGPR